MTCERKITVKLMASTNAIGWSDKCNCANTNSAIPRSILNLREQPAPNRLRA